MMGFSLNNQRAFLLILVAFFLVSYSFPCSASCNGDHHQILPKKNTPPPRNQPAAAAYQVLVVKNTAPFYLNKRPEFDKKRKRKKMMKRRKKNGKIKNFETRPFSVMLPKGFVPPSGSSPCHNDKPDSSVTFFCGLSAAKP